MMTTLLKMPFVKCGLVYADSGGLWSAAMV